jgi:hypothetical protein
VEFGRCQGRNLPRMAYMTTGGLDTAGELIRKEAGGANRMVYKHIPHKKANCLPSFVSSRRPGGWTATLNNDLFEHGDKCLRHQQRHGIRVLAMKRAMGQLPVTPRLINQGIDVLAWWNNTNLSRHEKHRKYVHCIGQLSVSGDSQGLCFSLRWGARSEHQVPNAPRSYTSFRHGGVLLEMKRVVKLSTSMQAVGWVYTEESFWIYTQRRKVGFSKSDGSGSNLMKEINFK